MAVKRYLAGIIFICLMLLGYLYLYNKYNIHTVEYVFEGDLSYEQFNTLRKSVKSLIKKGVVDAEQIGIVNFIGSYRDNRLIMTTGYDNLAKHIPMLKGNFIGDSAEREVVLGDRAADKLFRSIDVIGKTLTLQGSEYKIIGVIKNSGDIYISFDESMAIDWSKKNIKLVIADEKYLYLYIEMLETKLHALNLNILDRVIYQKEAYFYINIMLAIIIIALGKLLKKQMKRLVKALKKLYVDYIEQCRSIEVREYTKMHVRDICQNINMLVLIIITVAVILKAISFLQIPQDLLPDNLFSASSYINIVKQNLNIYINRLHYGISGILLDTYLINFISLIILVTVLCYQTKDSEH